MRRTLWLLALVVAAAPADAVIPPRQGGPLPRAYFTARESDATAYRLRGAWIGKSERVRGERAVSFGSLASHRGAGAAEAPSLSGTFAFPVLLGEFSNRPAGFEPSALDEKLFTGPSATGTLAEYFDEVSYGALSVTGLVADWVVTFQNDAYYEGSSNGLLPNDAKTGEFLQELLDANDGTIDFGDFDNDGPDGVPNSGDDDGFADLVVFVHSESGGECGGGSPNIWSHSWLYRGWPVSAGDPYETNDPCANGGTILVDDYAIQPGVSCAGGVIEIGGFCHETGHALGLPDLFDPDGGSSGAGHWDLMGLGAWNTAASPAHLSAWSRAELGWIAPTVVTWEGSVRTIPQIETDPTCYLLPFSDDRFRRMSECAIAGSFSLRCGLDAADAAARGWEGGSGYGNGWAETVARGFGYDGSAPVVLSFDYSHDLEPEADSAGVFLDIGGTRIALAYYTGFGSGTETIDISSHLGALTAPAAYTIEFVVKSDAAWSDEDGKNLTDCGAFVIDDLSVTGGGESYATGFESSTDGWGQNPDDNPPSEYWLVENRQPTGFDQHLHNSGLLVWHVDEEVIRSSLGNTGGTGNTAVRGLVLEEADGLGQLLEDPLTTGNAGDTGDPFPGESGNTAFGASSVPSSASNTGPPTEIEVSSIGPSGPTMTAFLRAGDPAPLVSSVAPSIVDNDLVSVGIGVEGDRIRSGATLRFAKTGEPDIAPNSVYWRDAGVLEGSYNVYSRKGGAWDVIVENPDGQAAVLAGGLNMVQIVAAQLQSARIGVTNEGAIELVFDVYGLEPDESLSLSRAESAAGPWGRSSIAPERTGERTFRFVDAAVEPGRIYYYRLEVWTAVGEVRELYRGEAETPAAGFALEPCVPNPFNPSTAIRFVLPQRADVHLVVYDVSGRVVRTLASETLPAGRHARVWDGRDNAGLRAGSGVYFCRLEAGSRRASVKVLLLK
jgi:M6 family metalloprotease-like protein